MSRERETLLDEIEQSLWTLTEDKLRHLCARCGIGGVDDSEVKGKSHRTLRRKLMEDYCEEDLMESEDEGMSWLLQLKDEIKGISDSEDTVKSLPKSPSQSAPTMQMDSGPSGETGAAAERKEEGGAPQPSREVVSAPEKHPPRRENGLGRYTKEGHFFLGALGSTGDETRCLMDDQVSNFPQLLNCDKVSNTRLTTWHFSQNESIINRATGRCLEVIQANVYFGHSLVLQTCSGQRWNIKNTMKQ